MFIGVDEAFMHRYSPEFLSYAHDSKLVLWRLCFLYSVASVRFARR